MKKFLTPMLTTVALGAVCISASALPVMPELVGAKNPEVVLYTYKIADGDRNIVQCAVWSNGYREVIRFDRHDNRSVDDWAISPLLNGKEQTITFYAKSLTARYSEQIEVLYTFSDNFVYEEYTKVDGFGTKMVSEEWTLFTALIPEGAKHFAIRSRAANGMMLLVDDVTFGPARPDLKGYNIYRDGTLLNAQPVAETSYLDTEALYLPHVYNVSAVYTDGESELSQSITLERTSVTDIFDGSDIIVTVNGLEITVSNATDTAVAISAVDGRQLFAANGDCRYSVPAPGVYLLTAGNRTAKLLVK